MKQLSTRVAITYQIQTHPDFMHFNNYQTSNVMCNIFVRIVKVKVFIIVRYIQCILYLYAISYLMGIQFIVLSHKIYITHFSYQKKYVKLCIVQT